MSKVIGIDLGTTNSAVAVMDNGDSIIITNKEGQRTTPSVIGFTKDGVLVGESARRQAVTNPGGTIYSAKRFIGSSFDDIASEAKKMPYKIVNSKGNPSITFDDKNYTPQEIAANVLSQLKQAAESFLGHDVTQAVVTVPAYFNDNQRQATKDAGKIAGLEILRIINEPTAAALAYGMNKKQDQKIAVYDLGGGTFDVSILEVGEGVVEVLSTNGNTHLGGDNFDEVLIEYLLSEFKTTTGIDLSNDSLALQRLKESAEKAKKELSSAGTTDINLPFLTANESGPQHLNITLSRSKFEQLIGDLVSKTLDPCRKALKDAKLEANDIDEVILVGGSTRTPLVQEKVKELFGKDPSKGVNPDEVVALGAAIQGGILAGDVTDILLLDVTPLSLGIETVGGVMTRLVDRNTTIPYKKSMTFSTAADNQSAVTIHVLQGEREIASGNMSLGNFNLADIPPAPRGVPQIEVTFDLDANGIINVAAKDLGTQKEQKLVITNESKLSDEEIDKMMKDAELNAEADKLKKEQVEAHNALDSLIFNTEKLLKENSDKIEEELKTEVEEALSIAKTKLSSEETEELKTAHDDLQTVVYKVSEAIYKQEPEANEESNETEETDENVVDADFEETDESTKDKSTED